MKTTIFRRLSLATVFLACFCAAGAMAQTCHAPTALRFARGMSSAQIGGAVARGERACWTIQAKAAQLVDISISSPEDNAVFQAYEPGWSIDGKDEDVTIQGKDFAGATDGSDTRKASGRLARSGKILIVVGTSRGGAPYSLTVTIH